MSVPRRPMFPVLLAQAQPGRGLLPGRHPQHPRTDITKAALFIPLPDCQELPRTTKLGRHRLHKSPYPISISSLLIRDRNRTRTLTAHAGTPIYPLRAPIPTILTYRISHLRTDRRRARVR